MANDPIVATAKKISEMDPLLTLRNEDMMEVVRLRPDGEYDNYRTNVSKLRTGKSVYDMAVDNGFLGTEAEYLASLQGRSAYDIAVSLGMYQGTEEEWVACIQPLYTNDPANEGMALIASPLGFAIWTALTKEMVGLDKVDNTSDLKKPVSEAVTVALRNYIRSQNLTSEVMKIILALPGFAMSTDGQALEIETSVIKGLTQLIDERIAAAAAP